VGKVILPIDVAEPQTLGDVVDDWDRSLREGRLDNYLPIPTGFPLLDEHLGGGLYAEDLTLVGGIQNVGKTVSVLQMARNIAGAGRALAIVVCYEHSPQYLLRRLLCLESIDPVAGPRDGGVTQDAINAAVLEALREGMKSVSFEWLLAHVPGAQVSWGRMSEYLEALWLVLGDGLKTRMDVLGQYVELALEKGYRDVVLFVDYLQFVPVRPMLTGEQYTDLQRIGIVMKALKSIAVQHHVPVVAVAAADEEALRRQRVHMENLWGPASVQYDPDVGVILNRGGAPACLPAAQAGTGRPGAAGRSQPVRWAIEKNRRGPSEVEMEMTLYGPYYAFNPAGRLVEAEESYQWERIALREQKASGPGGGPDLDTAGSERLTAGHSQVIEPVAG
jgi:hypothetical protein